jgi:hypothetical protein
MTKRSTLIVLYREEFVTGIINVGAEGIILQYDPVKDVVDIEGMERPLLERRYARERKPKVISKIPLERGRLFNRASESIDDAYDIICAIDTNWAQVLNKNVHVTGIELYEKQWIDSARGLERVWRFHSPFCIQFIELAPKQENAGWSAALHQLESQRFISRTQRVGVVVDSDLGNLEFYNQRKERFDGFNYLPSKWKFIYASDVTVETLPNHAIRNAHKISHSLLRLLATGAAPLATVGGKPPYFEASRLLFFKSKEVGF